MHRVVLEWFGVKHCTRFKKTEAPEAGNGFSATGGIERRRLFTVRVLLVAHAAGQCCDFHRNVVEL